MSDVFIVFCTFADPEQARQIGTQAVEKQLAACVNILPKIESIYRWENATQHDNETLALFKTTSNKLAALEHFLRATHSYTIPEFLAIRASNVSEPYAKWVHNETTP